MKSYTCMCCRHVFASKKFKPFCSPACRHASDATLKKSNSVYPEGTQHDHRFNRNKD